MMAVGQQGNSNREYFSCSCCISHKQFVKIYLYIYMYLFTENVVNMITMTTSLISVCKS